MDRPVGAQVAELLRSAPVQRIDFHLGGLGIGPREFRWLADEIDAGRVAIQVTPHEGRSARGSYDSSADTIVLRGAVDLAKPSWRATALHECTHAIVDMTKASATRALTDELAAHLVESLYTYQVLGRREFERLVDRATATYGECQSLMYLYLVEAPTDATRDPPLKSHDTRIPPALYQGALAALKEGSYSRLGWTDLSWADGLSGRPAVWSPPRDAGPAAGAAPGPTSDATLDELADRLHREFGGPTVDAGPALRRSVAGLQRHAESGFRTLVGNDGIPGLDGGQESYDALLGAARDLVGGAYEQTDPLVPTPPPSILPEPTDRGTDDLLEHARALAYGTPGSAPMAWTPVPDLGTRWPAAGWLSGDTPKVASFLGESAAKEFAAPATWTGVQEAALLLTEDVAAEAAAEAQAAAPWKPTTGFDAADAAYQAARRAAESYDWAGRQAATFDLAREAATGEALRTMGVFETPSTWQRLGAALGHDQVEDFPSAGNSAALPSSTFGRVVNHVAAERAFDAASTSVLPFMHDTLRGGLDSMHTAAFDAASSLMLGAGRAGGFARYDAGFDPPRPGPGVPGFGDHGGFGGVDAGYRNQAGPARAGGRQ